MQDFNTVLEPVGLSEERPLFWNIGKVRSYEWRFAGLAAVSLFIATFFSSLIPECVLAVLVQYLILRFLVPRGRLWVWLGILFPLCFFFSGTHSFLQSHAGKMVGNHWHWILFFSPGQNLFSGTTFSDMATGLGYSYLALRLSYSALEVGSDRVNKLTLAQFVSYAFYFPVLLVGPITPLSFYLASLKEIRDVPFQSACLRISLGLLKFAFLSKIFETFSYDELLTPAQPWLHHSFSELVVAALGYYGFLYCNFSGLCDIAVGLSIFLGVDVVENFDRPWRAVNIRDFWNRWHISIGTYFREVVFFSLTEFLSHAFGVRFVAHAVAISLFSVFLLLGLWHGFKLHFLIYASLHGAAVVGHHYYTLTLRRFCSPELYRAYRKSAVIKVLAVTTTFIFTVATLFCFAHDVPRMRVIFHTLRM